MSSSCCGGASKAEPAKVAATSAPQTIGTATGQAAAKSNKSECCKDDPSKGEKHSCGC
jgi:hypothetical protein